MDNRQLSLLVATKTLALLDERKVRLYPERTSFYVWVRDDRAVVIFDTNVINISKINAEFAHLLSTRLQGRRVVRTNSRGLYLQVGYQIPPVLPEFSSVALDLSKQPTPYHLPIGTTQTGNAMWISLIDGDSFLIGGTRGLGKTGVIHGMIQAMLYGDAVEVYGFDGKGGTEFGRYADQSAKFHIVTNLSRTLDELKAIARERRKILLASGQPNAALYNETHPESPMLPIALIVDEAALTSDDEKAGLVTIVERERATGFHPILATNRPEAAALLVKSNLSTRICLPVPSWNASQMVLGQNGAEDLPKIKGRGLIVFKASVTEFQSFHVTYPAPSEDTVRMLLQQQDDEVDPQPQGETNAVDEIKALAEQIREKWTPGLSGRAVGRLIGKTYGGYWKPRIDQMIEYLSATTATATKKEGQNPSESGIFEPVAG